MKIPGEGEEKSVRGLFFEWWEPPESDVNMEIGTHYPKYLHMIQTSTLNKKTKEGENFNYKANSQTQKKYVQSGYGWNSESQGMFGVVCNFYKFICQKLIVVHDYNKTKDAGVFLTCFHFCKFQKKFSDFDDTKINVNRFLLLFIYV